MANIHNLTPHHSEAACCCSHSSSQQHVHAGWKTYLSSIVSFCLLIVGLIMDHLLKTALWSDYIRFIWYLVAYLMVGFPVLKQAFSTILQRDFFNEFTLMSVATLGAFMIGEYPEGVAVMLFYSVGELFQDAAVNKARNNIKALLDIRPATATVIRNAKIEIVSPDTVSIGEVIQVKVGEKVALDGRLLSDAASFNTAALTGESVPKTIRKGEPVLSGMLNLDGVIEVEVEKEYQDSALSRILEMVQNAVAKKARTELLIRRFARIYTPLVFLLALAIVIIPWLLFPDYEFSSWLYKALVFLVISCPCALVVSIPLGYFGGIGAASQQGILFKGANYLDLLPTVNVVVMDKTGTLTKGVFNVQKVVSVLSDKNSLLEYAVNLEKYSNHPVAKAIVEYGVNHQVSSVVDIENVKEFAGYGVVGNVTGKEVCVGNNKLMRKFGIEYDKQVDIIPETTVIVAVNGEYIGYLIIADEVKEDTLSAITQMRKQGIQQLVLLSGDKSSLTQKLAGELGLDAAYGDLLPEDKLAQVEKLKEDATNIVAFIGDGINDTPVLALSDVGVAMGGMGADAAIEIADVVLQTDQLTKFSLAVKIAKATRQIILQNITMALGIKGLVLLFGALGFVSMWMAVFADVGVALLAILNSIRILKKKFD